MVDFNKIFQSKVFKIILWSLGGLIITLFVFKAGMSVGFRKASFSYQWGENYHKNFAGPRGGFLQEAGKFFQERDSKDFIDAYGVFGQIIKIDGQTFVVKGRGNVEKVVVVKDSTSIQSMRNTLKLSDLKVDDNIVVIGDPNSAGQIEAKFIRLMPSAEGTPLPPPPVEPRMRR